LEGKVDIQFFRTFLVVVRLENMTQAAEQLNFTQPTITGQVRALEQHFGVMLFDRIGKKLYITEAGKALADYAEKILALHDEAQKAISVIPATIRLGIATTAVNYILAPYIQAFQKQEPHCSISMEMCPNSSVVVKGIMDNRFDFGFVQNEVTAEKLTGFEVFKDLLAWVVQPKLAAQYGGCGDAAEYPLLGYKRGGLFYELYEKALGRMKNAPVLEYSDSEAMKNAILQGLGVGALPMVMIGKHLDDKSLIELKQVPRQAFSVWAAFHKDKVLSRSAMQLIKILQKPAQIKKDIPL
jgi:DNA-binding transcriptional LysR family regulator